MSKMESDDIFFQRAYDSPYILQPVLRGDFTFPVSVDSTNWQNRLYGEVVHLHDNIPHRSIHYIYDYQCDAPFIARHCNLTSLVISRNNPNVIMAGAHLIDSDLSLTFWLETYKSMKYKGVLLRKKESKIQEIPEYWVFNYKKKVSKNGKR